MHAAAAPMQPQVADVYYEGGVDPDITAFQQHQKSAPRPQAAEEARTWATLARYADHKQMPSSTVPVY